MAKTEGARGRDLGKPLPYLVAAHVGYELGSPEDHIAKHSPFLSFSTHADMAANFADRTGKKLLRPCTFEQATHFIWRLTLPALEPYRGLGDGVYVLKYRASADNVRAFLQADIIRANRGDDEAAIRAALTQLVHGYIAADHSEHIAAIIDIETLLESTRQPGQRELWDRALERARRSSEWLVYPMDLMPDGHGFSARLSLNRFLAAFAWSWSS